MLERQIIIESRLIQEERNTFLGKDYGILWTVENDLPQGADRHVFSGPGPLPRRKARAYIKTHLGKFWKKWHGMEVYRGVTAEGNTLCYFLSAWPFDRNVAEEIKMGDYLSAQ
jgi:hypothetical protein